MLDRARDAGRWPPSPELAGAAVLAALALVATLLLPAAGPPLWAATVVVAAAGPLGLLAPLAAGLAPVAPSTRLLLAAGGAAAWVIAVVVRRRAESLAERAFTDRLTGLYSYDYFAEAFDRELRRVARYGGELSLLVLDLDHFKAFNDRYGHAAGNALLTRVGRVLQRAVRDSDVAARFGGEELVVLVHGGARDAAALADRVRRAVSEADVETPLGLAGTTVSAGVSAFPEHPDAKALFEAADAALYQAKRRGRNRVVVARAEVTAARRRVA